jgi:phosphocarrier protein HPr
MVEQQINVVNALGIHARPASKIVQTANRFKCRITLVKDTTVADAKSILHVMMLGAGFGSTVLVKATGDDEKDAVAALSKLFADKFDEE